MDQETPPSLNIPTNYQSGSDGSQEKVPQPRAINITNSKTPPNPVGGVLNGFAAEDSRSLGSAGATRLVAASFEALDRQLHEVKILQERERTAREVAEKRVIQLETSNASKKKVDVFAAFLLVLGPTLISQGIDLSNEASLVTEEWMVGFGTASLVLGLLAQLSQWKN